MPKKKKSWKSKNKSKITRSQALMLVGFVIFLLGAIVFVALGQLVLGIANIIIAGLFLYGFANKKDTKLLDDYKSMNYDTFVIMGFIFLIVGLASGGSALWILGLIFVAVGLGGKTNKKRRK